MRQRLLTACQAVCSYSSFALVLPRSPGPDFMTRQSTAYAVPLHRQSYHKGSRENVMCKAALKTSVRQPRFMHHLQ